MIYETINGAGSEIEIISPKTKINKITTMDTPEYEGQFTDVIELLNGKVIHITPESIDLYNNIEDWNEGETLCVASFLVSGGN